MSEKENKIIEIEMNRIEECSNDANGLQKLLTNYAKSNPKDFADLMKTKYDTQVWFDSDGAIGGYVVPKTAGPRDHIISDPNLTETISGITRNRRSSCISRD